MNRMCFGRREQILYIYNSKHIERRLGFSFLCSRDVSVSCLLFVLAVLVFFRELSFCCTFFFPVGFSSFGTVGSKILCTAVLYVVVSFYGRYIPAVCE